MGRSAPTYHGLKPVSGRASSAARGSSRKMDTKPELLLRSALWKIGLRYRKNVKDLPGKPDLVFRRAKIAVFVDGDFWHGRDWNSRKHRLRRGTNPDYWIAKIEGNILRDRRFTAELAKDGWHVLRFWETDLADELRSLVDIVESAVSSSLREPNDQRPDTTTINRS